jgi:hypothetical protein
LIWPTFCGSAPASPARKIGGGIWIVPILKLTVFETFTKRILIRTVTLTMMSILLWPALWCASNEPSIPMLAKEMPNSRASTLAEKSRWKWISGSLYR